MTITRSPRKQRDFTIISNSVCLDQRLTMRALGVLVRLLSRPDNWRTNSEGLAAEFGVGRDAVRGALHELQKAGYIRMHKSQNAAGHWSSSWLVFDEPVTDDEASADGCADVGKADAGKPDVGKADAITRTDVPRTDVPRNDEGKARKRAPDLRPEDVAEQVWADWCALRKSKKAAVTATALEGIRREAKRSGLTMQQALETCCANGWQGLKAEWLAGKGSNGKPAKASRHTGFDAVNYSEGINDDGSF